MLTLGDRRDGDRDRDVEALAGEIAAIAARRDVITHTLLTRLRAFDEAEGWAQQGARTFAHWLNWRVGMALGAAREHVRVARALGRLPRVDTALREGVLSYSKARAVTRVATADNEETLVLFARDATASQLERICRAYARVVDPDDPPLDLRRFVRRRWTDAGMVRIELQVTADEADLVMRALAAAGAIEGAPAPLEAGDVPAEMQPETFSAVREVVEGDCDAPAETLSQSFSPTCDVDVIDEAHGASAETPDVSAGTSERVLDGWSDDRRADALLMMCESFLGSAPVARNGGDRWQVMVHLGPPARAGVDRDGEGTAWTALLEDGSRVDPAAIRRIACDAGLVAVAEDAHGTPLDVGRRTRAIPAALRRALLARDGGCRFPGCTNRLWVDAHHVRHWLEGGETSLANTLLVCRAHHRLLHEGGFGVEVGADGVTFVDAAGRRIAVAPRAAAPARADQAEGDRPIAPLPLPAALLPGEFDLASAVESLVPSRRAVARH